MSQFWQKKHHVAARGAHAEDARARKKMVQRFFFDGIHLQRRGRAIAQAVELPVMIHANEAEACLACMNVAMPGTQIAVHAAMGFGLPPTGLVQRF